MIPDFQKIITINNIFDEDFILLQFTLLNKIFWNYHKASLTIQQPPVVLIKITKL